jgi:hypothetical protein
MSTSAAEATNAPWYSAYPPPRHTGTKSVSREAMLQLLRNGKKPGVDFLLVDLRRMDHEVGLMAHPETVHTCVAGCITTGSDCPPCREVLSADR